MACMSTTMATFFQSWLSAVRASHAAQDLLPNVVILHQPAEEISLVLATPVHPVIRHASQVSANFKWSRLTARGLGGSMKLSSQMPGTVLSS